MEKFSMHVDEPRASLRVGLQVLCFPLWMFSLQIDKPRACLSYTFDVGLIGYPCMESLYDTLVIFGVAKEKISLRHWRKCQFQPFWHAIKKLCQKKQAYKIYKCKPMTFPSPSKLLGTPSLRW